MAPKPHLQLTTLHESRSTCLMWYFLNENSPCFPSLAIQFLYTYAFDYETWLELSRTLYFSYIFLELKGKQPQTNHSTNKIKLGLCGTKRVVFCLVYSKVIFPLALKGEPIYGFRDINFSLLEHIVFLKSNNYQIQEYSNVL